LLTLSQLLRTTMVEAVETRSRPLDSSYLN
jgi:hypothetical protein